METTHGEKIWFLPGAGLLVEKDAVAAVAGRPKVVDELRRARENVDASKAIGRYEVGSRVVGLSLCLCSGNGAW